MRITSGRRAALRRLERVRHGATTYGRQLAAVARHIGVLAKGYAPDARLALRGASPMAEALRAYAALLRPWAERVASRMVAEVDARDKRAWAGLAKTMGVEMRRELATTQIGVRVEQLIREQVGLITSLPIEAAERAQRLAAEGLADSSRADERAKDIMRTGDVTASRARLIAFTEGGRAASALTEARAESVGSEDYTWRTAEDADVRPDHKILNGRTFRWDSPPIADQRTGMRYHPGAGPGCRCYAEPRLPI